jgi:hypothetical protein
MTSDKLPTPGPRGVDQLERACDRVLASLPRFAPAARFAELVMARVRLPSPWYVSLWAAVRAHWVATVTAAATVTATAVATTYWMLSNPSMTPGGLAIFVWEETRQLAWRALVSVGRFAFDTGIPTALSGLAEQVQPAQALLALAAVSLLGIGASLMMLRLIRTPMTAHVGGRRR